MFKQHSTKLVFFFFNSGEAFLLRYFLTVVSGAQASKAGTLGLYELVGFSPRTSQLRNFSGGHQFSSASLYLLFSGTSSQVLKFFAGSTERNNMFFDHKLATVPFIGLLRNHILGSLRYQLIDSFTHCLEKKLQEKKRHLSWP